MRLVDRPAQLARSTETAVIVPVPAAEAVAGPRRAHFDPAASWGVPAHVTVLYPFVPPALVDERVLSAVAAAVRSVPAFDCEFGEIGRFGDEVLWLRPDPSRPFRDLTAALWRAFPEHPPYGGAYDEVTPHLTIAHGTGAPAFAAIEAELRGALPVRQRVERAVLLAGSAQRDSWRAVAEFALSS